MYRRINDPKRRSPYDLIKHFSPPYPVLKFSNPEIEQEVRLVLTAKVNESQDPSSDNYTKFFPKPYPVLQFNDPKKEREFLLSVIPSRWLHRKCKKMYPKRKN